MQYNADSKGECDNGKNNLTNLQGMWTENIDF